MSVGFRAYKSIKRPDSAVVAEFSKIPSANIGDALKRMYCMFGGIKPFNKKSFCGAAVTVKLPAGDNLAAQTALDYIQPGDIMVIDGAGYEDRAVLGGMMLEYAKLKQVGGFVVNGAIRDLDEVKASQIPVFAKSVTSLGPYREGPGEINVPVVCGGQVVMPGDILVGDTDGVVVIPRDFAQDILEKAKANYAYEQSEMANMQGKTYTTEQHIHQFTDKFIERGGVLIE